VRHVVAAYGTPVRGLEAFGLSHLFPPASKLAQADYSSTPLSERTRCTLRSFAIRVISGDVLLDSSIPLDQLIRDLVAIPGMSARTAEYIAFRLGERDAFPVDIVAPAESAAVDDVTLPAQAEQWRPWRSIAAMHLHVAYSPQLT
jgi:AraC family transcriptional regulator of adaptative response / DNA-3-methyladenine glycosylase II